MYISKPRICRRGSKQSLSNSQISLQYKMVYENTIKQEEDELEEEVEVKKEEVEVKRQEVEEVKREEGEDANQSSEGRI